ncbi:hypothetical protein MKX03_032083 [Papaver bracteatum]|nr:hypothetical protein MKX03_032083 [Papaver bracteatum]
MWKQVEKMFSSGKDSRLDNLDDTYTSFCRSPLHIAVMSGDINFATKILSRKPQLALKQDSNGFTPLHLASVRTSLRMVRLLLKAEPGACIVQDEDGRTPLYLASMKNRVEIMKALIKEGLPEAIHVKNDQNGETILHCCVKSNTNLETLELLTDYLVDAQHPYPDSISINSTDNDGNTILHHAVEMGNMRITDYLLLNRNVRIDINITNKKGLKALNMLSQAKKNDLKFGFYDYHVRHDKHTSKTSSKNGDEHEGLRKRVNALMVVATLIATIAFQAAMSPPGGVWQDDSRVNSNTDPVTFAYYLGSMYGSYVSGGLEDYMDTNMPYDIISDNKGGYFTIKDFVNDLTNISSGRYEDMMEKGLILEDFGFTDAILNYNNSLNISTSTDEFFPYLIRYAGYPILAYTFPNNYVIYMVTNGVALLASLTIIALVACGFMIETTINQVRFLVVLMCISIACVAFSYMSILDAMLPGYYVEQQRTFITLQVIFGVGCILGSGLFIWTLIREIVKLRKRMWYQHIEFISYLNYLEAFFLSMDAKAAGKLILFTVSYFALRLDGYIYYGSWSKVNLFLY